MPCTQIQAQCLYSTSRAHLTWLITLHLPSAFLSRKVISPGRLPNPHSARNLPCITNDNPSTTYPCCPAQPSSWQDLQSTQCAVLIRPRNHLRIPSDDIVGPSAQVKHRLALRIKEYGFGWHEACHHDEEGAIRRPLSIMNGPILHRKQRTISNAPKVEGLTLSSTHWCQLWWISCCCPAIL